MKTLTLGGCRIPVSLDVTENLTAIKQAIDWAHSNGVSIISTPECALSGYMWRPHNGQDPRLLQLQSAEKAVADYSLAKGVDLVLGTAGFNDQGEWANMQLFIIDGQTQRRYAKQLLCGPEIGCYAPGQELTVIDYKGFKITGLICNDLWSNPLLWPGDSAFLMQELKSQQVDVVFVSAYLPHAAQEQALFNVWNDTCIRMYSLTGCWVTVTSDRTIDGAEGLGPVGIVDKQGTWQVRGSDFATDYFKHTVS